MMRRLLMYFFVFIIILESSGRNWTVGNGKSFISIKRAIQAASTGDTVSVHGGIYKEGNITIDKAIFLLGLDSPVLDGEKRNEIVSVKSDSVLISGFILRNSNFATLEDPAAIKVYNSNHVTIENNVLENNFFGIYIQYGKHCTIKNNKLTAYGKDEQMIGNGIHCWKSDSLLIIANQITGHRDGIYFEFVTNSVIWRNVSYKNIRYGLHFMFSNDDAYISNIFRKNGSGVAVMFTKNVKMFANVFEENWGDASYGLLLKEISDSYILGNDFVKNTAAIYLEGVSRTEVARNDFDDNGWGMKIQASCMENTITHNNFFNNTFDISTNGTLVLSKFNGNYWDKYEGYDLDKNMIGDVPFHPLSLFSMIAESNPSSMLMYRSFVVMLMDRTERVMPSLTPENFVDDNPNMMPFDL